MDISTLIFMYQGDIYLNVKYPVKTGAGLFDDFVNESTCENLYGRTAGAVMVF